MLDIHDRVRVERRHIMREHVKAQYPNGTPPLIGLCGENRSWDDTDVRDNHGSSEWLPIKSLVCLSCCLIGTWSTFSAPSVINPLLSYSQVHNLNIRCPRCCMCQSRGLTWSYVIIHHYKRVLEKVHCWKIEDFTCTFSPGIYHWVLDGCLGRIASHWEDS